MRSFRRHPRYPQDAVAVQVAALQRSVARVTLHRDQVRQTMRQALASPVLPLASGAAAFLWVASRRSRADVAGARPCVIRSSLATVLMSELVHHAARWAASRAKPDARRCPEAT